MKLALISDIHANLQALEAVFKKIETLNVDMIVALGDFVGYGAQPNEVIDLVKKYVDITIIGNHDAAVLNKIDYSDHRESAKHVIDWTRNQLTDENYSWLNRLPYTRKYKHIGFTHGTPIAPEDFGYVYTMNHAYHLSNGCALLPQISFIGHSHLIKGYVFNKMRVNEILLPRKGFRDDSKYLFSVGSVGQPRDGNPFAAFLTYDLDEASIMTHRVYYNVSIAAKKILDSGLDEHFAQRIFLGY